MATSATTRTWTGLSRRRVPRFQVQAPLDVTVLRSGVPDTVPGRSVNVCERGMSAVLAGGLGSGEGGGGEGGTAPGGPTFFNPGFVRALGQTRVWVSCIL